MGFVFTRRFYILFAAGLLPLSFSWSLPALRYFALVYDVSLVVLALADYLKSRDTSGFGIERSFAGRFAIGGVNDVTVRVTNHFESTRELTIKDEFPPGMELCDPREASFSLEPEAYADFTYGIRPKRRGAYSFGRTAVRFKSRYGLVRTIARLGSLDAVKVYPNIRRAREIELKALGAASYLAVRRRSVRKGEGREFESMRDYVRGDELRHISWTTTARRAKLTTRQYQIERDQTIIIALDAGRLMTGRIGDETKFDSAIHASLALILAAAKGGDHCGLAVFGRRIKKFLPPKKGTSHVDAILEALYDLEPELVEPSYSRAFRFISGISKKRSFVIILTDLIDKESSKRLLRSLKLFRPRHLPLIVTIGDRDLNVAVSRIPESIDTVFEQSAAEEIIHHRSAALRQVESLGGLALDVTTQTLAPRLLETYMRVKERGLL